MTFEELKTELESQGYFNIVQCTRTGKVYGLLRFIYTVGLVCEIDRAGYSFRYCYHNLNEALPAIRDWTANGFEGEPTSYIKRK